jgi:hypothetical protein
MLHEDLPIATSMTFVIVAVLLLSPAVELCASHRYIAHV